MNDQLTIPHSRPWLTEMDVESLAVAVREKSTADYRYSARLREQLKEFSGLRECLLFGSGTLALRSALVLLGFGAGRGVGIPSFSCSDLITAVIAAGGKPVILDCDENGLLCPDAVRFAHKKGEIKGAIAVHQFGLLNLGIGELASRMPIIEDCAHVPPGRYLPNSAAVTGSLEATKLLGAAEGGYLLLNEMLSPKNDAATVLGNRMSDLTAVIAMRQLDRLSENLTRRERIASAYKYSVGRRRTMEGIRAAWFRFLLRLDSLSEVERFIETARKYEIIMRRPIMPAPLHRIVGGSDNDFPVASGLWETTVSIPLYPDLSDAETNKIQDFLVKYFE